MWTRGVHLVSHEAVTQDHGQMEDASNRRLAVCELDERMCLVQVSNIQR